MRGKAWKFGDNISTDLIAPGRLFHLRSNLPELAKHVLEDADPDFPSKVRPGDFVVGARNFGCGSSREHAPTIIKLAGVSAVIATSFARIFYRNAVNVGLPAVTCDTGNIETGDELELDLAQGTLRNLTKKEELSFPPLPDVMRGILDEGGLVPFIKSHGSLDF
ncbi:MAG: 3-isopropylmalate dehydratase small subunit [Planctomycetes bacterium]|nr:3-isopropylmalate dehydratase small subunit [Planctomycetota bacterium]